MIFFPHSLFMKKRDKFPVWLIPHTEVALLYGDVKELWTKKVVKVCCPAAWDWKNQEFVLQKTHFELSIYALDT